MYGSPGQVPLCLKMETETLCFFKELQVGQSKKKGGILSVNFSHALFSFSFTFGYAGLGCST